MDRKVMLAEATDPDRICQQEFERYKILQQWGSKPQRIKTPTDMSVTRYSVFVTHNFYTN